MSKIISIIIPVYNVQEYLVECLESVINQTYSYLQIIVVDDGSTDDSGKICDEIAGRDKRIKIIHKKNGGLGNARNVGLTVATGDYIGFVDSDDKIELDMYEKLVITLESSDSDVAVCSYKEWKDGKTNKEVNQPIGNRVYNGLEWTDDYYFEQRRFSVSVWTKLYKREVVNDIKFSEGRIYEDIEFEYQALYRANRVSYIDEPLYYYRRDGETITLSAITKKKIIDAYEMQMQEVKFWEHRDKCISNKLLGRIYLTICREYGIFKMKKLTDKECLQELLRQKIELENDMLNIKIGVTLNNSKLLYLAKNNPVLYAITCKLIRK